MIFFLTPEYIACTYALPYALSHTYTHTNACTYTYMHTHTNEKQKTKATLFPISLNLPTHSVLWNSPMTRGLLVKCMMGIRAKGNCTLCRTFNHCVMSSNLDEVTEATTTVGMMEMLRVSSTLFHLAQWRCRNPCHVVGVYKMCIDIY